MNQQAGFQQRFRARLRIITAVSGIRRQGESLGNDGAHREVENVIFVIGRTLSIRHKYKAVFAGVIGKQRRIQIIGYATVGILGGITTAGKEVVVRELFQIVVFQCVPVYVRAVTDLAVPGHRIAAAITSTSTAATTATAATGGQYCGGRKQRNLH